jgi:hypothetical protein
VQILRIKTTKTNGGYKAWLYDDLSVTASSTTSAHTAAENLAVRVFVGHNRRAQIPEEVLSKIVVRPVDNGNYRATYDN